MADSSLLTNVLRLLTNRPQSMQRLLPLVLAAALGDEEIKAETATVYLCDPLENPGSGKGVATFACRVFMTQEGTPREDRGRPPSLRRFEENDGSVAGWVLANGLAHVCPNCKSCELYMKSQSEPQFKSLMCLPIVYGRTADDRSRVLGLINLHTKQSRRLWREEHVPIIEAWAHITGLVILANHHDLTMLPNRSFTEHLLTQFIKNRRPPYNDDLCLAYIDLDRFGAVNDEFGHRPANEVIQRLAAMLKDNAGDGVTVCHIHGDEFVLLIRNRTRDEALAKVRSLLAHIKNNQNLIRIGEQVVSERIGKPLTATAGLANWSEGMEAYQLIDVGDQANREQKLRKRGGVRTTWGKK